MAKKKNDKVEGEIKVITASQISEIGIEFHREDLNQLRDKLNEVIRIINK